MKQKLIFTTLLLASCLYGYSQNRNTMLVPDGASINVIGDSYVANHRRAKEETWHYKMAAQLGLQYRNYGRNGSCIAFDRTHDGRFNFGPAMWQRYVQMEQDADYVLIIAGHNDATKVGNNKDSLQMFCDSLECMLQNISIHCPGARLGFVTPWYVDEPGFGPVVAAIKRICKKHHIPVLCNYSKESLIRVREDDFRRKYFQAPNDRAHLNAAGHELFLPTAIEWFKKQVMTQEQNTKSDKIKINNITQARAVVWDEWCRKLATTDTLPAMSMDALELGNISHWQLPKELEPNAIMNFYSGTKGTKPAEGYPAFIYLHGSGPRDMEWNTGLRLAQTFDDTPCMYIIPQIPNEGQYYRWWQQSKQWIWSRLIRQLFANPNINPARLYLFGISEGGYGSQRLAAYYADYLAAAAPMAGGEPLRNAPAENLCRTAFSLVTGEKDAMFYRNKLSIRTGERLDSLQKLYPNEFKHRVVLEKEKGHAITYGVSTPWMKEYIREAQPTHFRWENFEMDGLKRNAFYNIEVLKEDGGERTDYEFSILDNVVNLEVKKVQYTITEKDPNWAIELNNTRQYESSAHGHVRIYLSEQMTNLQKPVKVYINGHLTYHSKVHPSWTAMRRSCLLYGDPLRIFPVSIDVQW